MRLYFSGVNDRKTYRMLAEAGVRYILVDQFDLKNVPGARPNVALDSGAYRAWKKNWTLDRDFYAETVAEAGREFDFVVNLDVFGDEATSRDNWNYLRWERRVPGLIPVWHWSAEADERVLEHYLLMSEVVGLGGLVPHMRDKNRDMLECIKLACRMYPRRFHVFGLNWLEALHELKDLLWSADTSKWLDGARYRHLISYSEDHRQLVQTTDGRGREALCIENARNMEAYVSGLATPLQVERDHTLVAPKRRPYVLRRANTATPRRDKDVLSR